MLRNPRRVGMGTLFLVLWGAVLLASCERPDRSTTNPIDDNAITVGSFNFPESVLLAEIYAQALEARAYSVDRQLDLGTRELVEPALERGLVEFVPEYSGSALAFVTKGKSDPTPDLRTTHRALQAALEERGIIALEPAPAEDKNGVVVRAETAERLELSTISDLSPVASMLVFGGPPECPERPLCLPGLEAEYGLSFKDFTPLDSGGPLTVQALAQRQIDVALLFTTDGAIDANGFLLLEDDRMLQPAENVTPVVRREVVERLGDQFVRLVNAVSKELTTEELRGLNARVSIEGAPPRDVAEGWLGDHGVLRSVG
jgi:osmoprotectant transport system substrate-binding protein